MDLVWRAPFLLGTMAYEPVGCERRTGVVAGLGIWRRPSATVTKCRVCKARGFAGEITNNIPNLLQPQLAPVRRGQWPMDRNVERDRRAARQLTDAGWRPIVVWQHEDLAGTADRTEALVRGTAVSA